MGLVARKPVSLREFANKKGADQPAHPRSLISVSFIRLLISIISSLTTSEMSCFMLVSVAEQTCFNLTFSEPPKTGFLATRLHMMLNHFESPCLITICYSITAKIHFMTGRYWSIALQMEHCFLTKALNLEWEF